MTRIAFGLIAITTLSACGAKHAGTFDVGEATVEGDAAPALAEAASLWAQRTSVDSLQAALVKYEEVLTMDPGNRTALEQLARGYYFLGDGHLTADADKKTAWDTSINYGKQCMGLNEAFKASLEKGDVDEVAAAANLTADDVACTYWTASALGKWAGLQSLGVKLKNIPSVKAWIARVEALDASYYYAATDRYWGAYWAAIPSFAGRDLDKSRSYLDKAIAAHPAHFGNRVLLASYWAEKTQDVSVFDEQIAYVLNNCANGLDALVPEQEAEQRKAQALLDRRDEMFIDAGSVPAPEIAAPVCEKAAPAVEATEEAAPEGEAAEGEATEGDATEEAEASTEGSTDEAPAPEAAPAPAE